jgi:type IV secretory pathway TrbD component
VPAKVRLLYAVPILIVTVVAVVIELWLTAFIGFGLLIWMTLGARRQQARPPDTPEA